MSWDTNLALIWTKMVGPSRPTISELNVYTKYAHKLMEHKKTKLSLLVLGSTPEFRDWGYEENMTVTVMDKSKAYNSAINRELRHKLIVENLTETFIESDWQQLSDVNKYDIIIGDLAIGNIHPEHLDGFLQKVSNALKEDGLFLGKSFFVPRNYKTILPKDLILNYYKNPPYHPYSALVFDLTMYCLDENNLLDFQIQYNELMKLYKEGILKEETFVFFENVGWESEMKFKFYVPSCDTYECLVKKYMKIISVEYGNDVYSKNFPLYIITKKQSCIYGG